MSQYSLDRSRHAKSDRVDLRADVVMDAAGHRISAGDADRAASAAERGDLEIDESGIVYPRRVGRPALDPTAEAGVTSPKVEARVPAQLKARLSRYARQSQKPTAEIVRDALEEYLPR